MRGALQNAVNSYITSNYPSEASAAGVFTKDANTYSVVVTGEKTSLKNFWSGRWSSSWTLSLADTSCTISGDIKVHIHYFEDGNLQLQSSKSVPAATLQFSSEADLGQKIVKHMQVR